LDLELRLELLGENGCVVRPHSERNQRARVAEYRVSNVRLQLVHVLVRKHEPNPVFNAAQVENWVPPDLQRPAPVEIDRMVALFADAVGANVGHGYQRACYRPDLDTIEMPSPTWFFDTPTRTAVQAYHGVLFHELTHWTGPTHRCDREFGKRFGDKKYAFEELVAELGAAFLSAAFKITNEPREDHAAYLADWLELLGSDPKVIFTAANKAQEAVEYLGSCATGTLDGVTQ